MIDYPGGLYYLILQILGLWGNNAQDIWRAAAILVVMDSPGFVVGDAHRVHALDVVSDQADVDFVAKMSHTLPDGCLVISEDPCMWLLQGTNSSQFFIIDRMVHEEMRELVNQYPGGVFVHWGFWQNAEPGKAASIAKLLVETNAKEVARTQSQAFTLAVFRIDTPEAIARFGGKPPVNSSRRDTDLDRQLTGARAEGAPAGTAPAP